MEQYVTFETAKLAKEKGFYVFTDKYFDSDNPHSVNIQLKERPLLNREGQKLHLESIEEESGFTYYQLEPINNAPSQSQLQKWLREVHEIQCYAYPFKDHAADCNDPWVYRGFRCGMKEFDTFEEALEADLQNGLNYISQ